MWSLFRRAEVEPKPKHESPKEHPIYTIAGYWKVSKREWVWWHHRTWDEAERSLKMWRRYGYCTFCIKRQPKPVDNRTHFGECKST